ncbi:hypothetical protein BLA39750_01135 [Burkholderia lata]|uniref:Uncharacterized protein n=1 Tax=Burkholderia lata (strain ATCC 17760 / DSM 23089 / LMG 22485 / NCIMB 9086 / R18194 / 383) TaxID=482957 RepID=A0A6P2VMW9_BURL3|nr:hypothetical protein [Burkholderia lata]VWC80134.1 hypothetical protein BLA39750_01135 [Burkholderia lata]
MIFDTMKRELRELYDHVKETTAWETTIACGKVKLEDVPVAAREEHHRRLERMIELQAKYGL